MAKRNTVFKLLFILIVVAAVFYVSSTATENVRNWVTIGTAIFGFLAVLYQLNRDHHIKRAEFVYSLNDSFNSDEKIMSCYGKLKLSRIHKQDFTEDELNDTGNYIMFFIIMNYLIQKGQVKISMIDKIFANKFFLLCHNEQVQKAQFQLKHVSINYPIMELYELWYNYRQLNGLDILYDHKNALANHEDLFEPKKGLIKFKHYKKKKIIFYINKLFGKANNASSFK